MDAMLYDAWLILAYRYVYFSAGHLHEHLRAQPSHQQYYSHKLKRLVIYFQLFCIIYSLWSVQFGLPFPNK
jgi:hypothetical protein